MRLALCALLLVQAASLRPALSDKQPDTSHKAKSAGTQQRGTDTLPIAVKLLNTGKSKEEAAQDSQRVADSKQDARNTFWLTVAIAVATVIQAIALIITIRDSRDTTRRQLRAYVFLDHTDAVTNPPFPQPADYKVVIKNSGQTPASDVRVQIRTAWARKGADDLPPAPAEGGSRGAIPSGGYAYRTVQTGVITPPLTYTVIAGLHEFYLYGTIRYRDTFGEDHTTTFKAIRLPNSHDFIACEDGNDAD